MKGYLIEGGRPLTGEVAVSGAKNAALPIMAASILTNEPVIIGNAPSLRDVRTFFTLLDHLGVGIRRLGDDMVATAANVLSQEAPYDLVKQMRASILVLGPLLARTGMARVSLPGGCAIGERPVDQHLKGLRAMGARIDIRQGYIEARAGKLRGARVCLDTPTVTGTENLMMAACLAAGRTTIENAAREPEVVDLAGALKAMGAVIEGAGEDTVTVEGVPALRGASYRVIPDRIEAATYLAAGLITRGRVRVKGCRPADMDAVTSKMRETGAELAIGPDWIEIAGPARPRAVDVRTMPYPGFPTDMQAQFMAVAAVADGHSVITESVFENRFMHAAELSRMGADITIQGHTAVVRGVPRLSGAPVMATDLRAGASLVVAALAAEGTTSVSRIYHLERGYDDMARKLVLLGASVREVQLE